MTAEIAVVNRSGVALAADSAVTVGRERVWKTTNKLFSLSPRNDIGIMVYGSGDFVGYPWDTVIKEFRRSDLHVEFSTVADAAQAFFRFLGDARFKDEMAQAVSIWSIFTDIAERLSKQVEYSGKMDFRSKYLKLCEAAKDYYIEEEQIGLDMDVKRFSKEFGKACTDIFKSVFEQKFPKALCDATIALCYEVFRRKVPSQYDTGIVFAGFGKDELLPFLSDHTVDGRFQGHVRHWENRRRDLNTSQSSGGIMPFGQGDMAYLFMEGISAGQEDYLRTTLREVLRAKSQDIVKAYVADSDERVVEQRLQDKDDDKLIDKFMEEFATYRNAKHIQPVMRVVSTLPKEEMAAMAEALVDVTSLRRKVDSRIESVAGPIDVAFISKGDGFIWIKRKHYFDLALNGDFTVRKNQETRGLNT